MSIIENVFSCQNVTDIWNGLINRYRVSQKDFRFAKIKIIPDLLIIFLQSGVFLENLFMKEWIMTQATHNKILFMKSQ